MLEIYETCLAQLEQHEQKLRAMRKGQLAQTEKKD
jgi:hypothetical protein